MNVENIKHNSIVLIGMSGAGKSTVGQLLSKKLCLPFVDTDMTIEARTGKTIAEIFKTHGEQYFRDLETDALKVAAANPCILSTGGGAVLKKENQEIIKRAGKIFFLDCTLETIISRLKNSKTRPLVSGSDYVEKITNLFTARAPVYKGAADFVVDGNRSKEVVAAEIISLYNG